MQHHISYYLAKSNLRYKFAGVPYEVIINLGYGIYSTDWH